MKVVIIELPSQPVRYQGRRQSSAGEMEAGGKLFALVEQSVIAGNRFGGGKKDRFDAGLLQVGFEAWSRAHKAGGAGSDEQHLWFARQQGDEIFGLQKMAFFSPPPLRVGTECG